MVDKDFPPTFVWYSTADKTATPENSIMLLKALEHNKIPYQSMEFHTVPHGIGLGLGSECEPWFDEAIKFWRKMHE
ncbi:MAG: hypothetical protein IJ168_03825 [Eubacterium sp.]|nr:hypothetical protein [Eubacterium sp.]